MSTYEQKKEAARQKAIDYQNIWTDLTADEIEKATEYFEKVGKYYGLLKEFRENWII